MSTPLISIVLPTYNGSRYIRESIESCLAQTFRDFELIIVNDCSTDNTWAFIEEYAAIDPRIVTFTNPFNKKLPLSLNAGFEIAKGSYFTWTSDDNFYAKDALKTMLDILQQNDSIDLVYADYTLIDDKNQIIGSKTFGDINESFHNWLGCGACFLYKKEVHLKNNGYRPEAFLIEDYDFFVRAFLYFRFNYLPVTNLYFYREHGSSLTSTQRNNINDISKIFLERNLPGIEKKLSKKETGLLYRKFAVFNAVQKNNATQYKYYLDKLRSISIGDVWKTIFYVLLMKFRHAITIGFSGILYAFENTLKRK